MPGEAASYLVKEPQIYTDEHRSKPDLKNAILCAKDRFVICVHLCKSAAFLSALENWSAFFEKGSRSFVRVVGGKQ